MPSRAAILRVPEWVAPRLELLEVRQLANVDLPGEVPADRLLEGLVGVEVAAREGPRPRVGILCALPEQRLSLPARTWKTTASET